MLTATPAARTILRVLTMEGLDTHPSCTGTMTCDCKTCGDQRAKLLKRGPIGSGPQPWTGRADRRELRKAA